jgi:hypothetical protein
MSVDLTDVCVSLITGFFGVATIVIPYIINARMKDKQAALVIDNAITNSIGAMNTAATAGVQRANPQVTIPGITPVMATGVQYVLDHAGQEAARYGMTQEAVADKIKARIGNQQPMTAAVASIAVTGK